MILISIPGYRKVRDESGEYTVFEIHVAKPGGQAIIEKRYSEFSKLNKKLREIIHPPGLPPKTLLNKSSRVLETRREGLELYLQSLLGSYVVYDLLGEFLDGLHLPTAIPSRTSSTDELDADEDSVLRTTHQNLLLFMQDPVLKYFGSDGTKDSNPIPDTVVQGVLEGVYGDDTLHR